jgi:hypothetical protein
MTPQQWATKYRTGRAGLWAIDLNALAWLAQLRLMTTAQVQTLGAPHVALRHVRASLARLYAADLVGFVPLAAGRRVPHRNGPNQTRVWFLTPAGLDVAEPAHARNYRITAEKAGNDKQAHALAVTDVAAAFARWLREGGHDITPGDCEAEFAHLMADRSAQRFANLQVSDLRIRMMLNDPDGDIAVTRLIEVDRGTESVQLLVDKVRNYARVLSYKPPQQRDKADGGLPAWRLSYPKFPKLIFVWADPSADQARTARRQDQFLNLLREERLLTRPLHELGLSCTSLNLLQRRGPFAAIFTPHDQADAVDLLGQARRVALAR